jgi:UDP-glucose 4-epimerase
LAGRPEVTQVVALDDLSTGTTANLEGLDLRLVEGSILDRPLLASVVGEADAVVHLAARPSVPRSLDDPLATHEANATGTLNVLEECRRRSTYVVAASSSSVYGSAAYLPKHEDLPTRPLSPYAASKLASEAYLLAYLASFGVPALALRFFNVYGPLQSADHAYAAVVPAFVSAALRGEPLPMYGDGTQTRDFTYVGTVTEVLADAVVQRTTCDTPVNLAFGTRVSLLELHKRLSLAVGRPLDLDFRQARRGDVHDSQAANDRLRELFPHVTPVPLDTGLRETIAWFNRTSSPRSELPAGV